MFHCLCYLSIRAKPNNFVLLPLPVRVQGMGRGDHPTLPSSVIPIGFCVSVTSSVAHSYIAALQGLAPAVPNMNDPNLVVFDAVIDGVRILRHEQLPHS